MVSPSIRLSIEYLYRLAMADMHPPLSAPACSLNDDGQFSDYVAHLQLHMALQARNLLPTIIQATDSRQQLLQQTQADAEKLISRQIA